MFKNQLIICLSVLVFALNVFADTTMEPGMQKPMMGSKMNEQTMSPEVQALKQKIEQDIQQLKLDRDKLKQDQKQLEADRKELRTLMHKHKM